MEQSVSVLFICVHNGARSQMAAAYLQALGGAAFRAESAGLAPTGLPPLLAAVMAEDGLDLSAKCTRSVFDLLRAGRQFDYAITVCREAETYCPVFPERTRRVFLPFPDPAAASGSEASRLARTREIRESIKARVRDFVAWVTAGCTGRFGAMGLAGLTLCLQ